MRETHHAPGRLELVREFVNSRDVEEGTDEFADLAGTTAWLRAHGLAPGSEEAKDADRKRLIAAREALRTLLLSNNSGDAAPAQTLEVLNESSTEVALALRFGSEGSALVSACDGANAVLAEVLAVVHGAMGDGTWERLKVCPAPNCLWAFYDRSRNRSATWCQMGACGNRSKARAFRARRSGQ